MNFLFLKGDNEMEQNEFNPIGIDSQLDWARIEKLLRIGFFASLIAFTSDMLLGWGVEDTALTGLERMFSAYTSASDERIFLAAILGLFGIVLEGLSYFGIYRLMASFSPRHAHNYRTGIFGYLMFGACGFHVPVCALTFLIKHLSEKMSEITSVIAMKYACFFILPSFVLFWIFFLILVITQISAFAKGLTPYPKWCWIFSTPVGMAIALFFGIFGNHLFVNAIQCAWISVGNIWMFGGLLIMRKAAQ